MTLHFDIACSDEDFEQILALQRDNHLDVVVPEQRADQGFVYARHTLPLLRAFASHLPQVIAREGDRVVGYTLAMPVALRHALPELVPMFEQFDHMLFRGRPLSEWRYMVGGQVCVASGYRGRGVLGQLYKETRRRLPAGYELCVTEVSERNSVSLKAHQRMGFETVGTYRDAQDAWVVVAWDLSQADSSRSA